MKTSPRILLSCLAVLAATGVAAAQLDDLPADAKAALGWKGAVPVPVMSLPPCKAPPTLDGNLRAGEWDDSCAMATFSHHGGEYAFPSAIAYVTYTPQRLYFGYVREKSEPTWFKSASRFRDSSTYMDPHIELFLSPDPGTGSELAYQFCINAYGAVYDILMVPRFGQTSPGYNPKIDFRTSETQADWTLEGSIDVKELDPKGRFVNGAVWRGNFCWAWPQIAWASKGGFWKVRDNMGEIRLDSAAPALQWLDVYPLIEGKLDATVGVKNVSDSPRQYVVSIVVTGESADEVLSRAQRKLDLKPGQREQFQLVGDKEFAGKKGHAVLTCTSGDDKTLYYRQYLRFSNKESGARARKAEAMKTPVPLPKEMVLTTRFGQLHNAVEVQADVWFLRRAGLHLKKVHVWVEPAGQHSSFPSIEKDLTHFQNDLGLCLFQMPADLPFGEYVARAAALDAAGKVVASAESKFTRLDLKSPEVNKPYQARPGRILDWIDTDCGVPAEVPTPWTPVAVNGGEIKVLNRTIRLAPSGLPNQIVAAGQELLAGPIRYVAVRDGKPVALELPAAVIPGRPVTVDPAGLAARWALPGLDGGGMRLTTRGTCEFDGMINYELAISCKQPVQLDALYLEIPLCAEIAKQLNLPITHVPLPEGKGIVWKSKDEVDNEMMNTLVSHVWLGDWRCGLSFVADDTKGWYEKMGESLQTISRDGDVVTLRVYFVQGPAMVDSTTLRFGLIATPTRTREPGWRSYPIAGGKEYFWWMDWYEDRQYPKGPDGMPRMNWDDMPKEQYDQLVHYKPPARRLPLPYTNPWFHYPAVMPWVLANDSPVEPLLIEDWANMPSRWGFVRPVKSYRDYMTFNYDFYFRHKQNGGFYIDEAYGAECPDINMINGSGWLDREGNLRGSYHSMDVRELFKRQYVISGKYSPVGKPFMLNHASWGISPQYMSFVTCAIWVENLPIGAGQCYLDHMPASTLQFWNGRAWGHFSDVTGLGADDAAKRYCSGELLLHDIRTGWNYNRPTAGVEKAFGLTDPNVEFIGYWEQPAVASSAKAVQASVYRKPGQWLLVVGNLDTAAGHDATLTPDAKALGLPKTWRATNAETGEAIEVKGGAFGVTLAPRDWRCVVIEPAP